MYYKNGDSATATHRALRGAHGLCNRPTTQAIDKIVKKFETGEVTNIERPVHHHFACSTENIAIADRPECVDSSSSSGIRTVLRHIMAYFAFRSSPTSI